MLSHQQARPINARQDLRICTNILKKMSLEKGVLVKRGVISPLSRGCFFISEFLRNDRDKTEKRVRNLYGPKRQLREQ